MNWFHRTVIEKPVAAAVRFVATVTRPRWFARWLCRWFARKYRIDVGLATKPLEQYDCLLNFFLRELRQGTRPIDSNPHAVVSPVDAEVTAIGRASGDEIILVKGTPCTMLELLGCEPDEYTDGDFVMLYLSPGDCHRIYAPCDGEVTRSWRIEGGARPVYPAAVERRPRTFVENRRVVTELRGAAGKVMVVKIGAMNVGRIPVNHPLPYSATTPAYYHKGDELAKFEFGSTVVALFERGRYRLKEGLVVGDHARIGEAIAYGMGSGVNGN